MFVKKNPSICAKVNLDSLEVVGKNTYSPNGVFFMVIYTGRTRKKKTPTKQTKVGHEATSFGSDLGVEIKS